MAELPTLALATDRRARWKWFLALGVLLLLLGLASAGASTLLDLTSLLLFGPLLMASSLMQLLTGFIAETGKPRLLHYAAAGLEAVLGFLLMVYPFLVVTDLVVLTAAFLIVIGLLRLARSLVTHSPGQGWAFLAGGGALVLGICIWLKLPASGLGFVGLCVAGDFLCHGLSWSALGLAERKPPQEQLTADPMPALPAAACEQN